MIVHDNCIAPSKIWRKVNATCGCRCCILYDSIAFTQVSNTSIFKRALNLRDTVWEIRSGLSCDPSERLCDGSQLMYFACCSLSCQTVFRVVSDWLNSLSVVFGCDANAKVFVSSESFSAKPEVTVLLLSDQELLQHGIHSFGSFRKTARQQVVHVGRHHSNDS